MVISLILIQHFLGILCATDFRATQIFEKFICWLHGHPNTATNKFQEFLWQKVFATKIHGGSHPISMRIPVTYLTTQYLSHEFSHKHFANETT